MRTSVGPSILLASAAITIFASCNPRVQVGNGECGSSGRGSAFCDDGEGYAPPPNPGECFGGGGCNGPWDPLPTPPPQCKTDSFSEPFVATVCVDHRQDPWKGGEACVDSRDCESVCCKQDDRGWWVPPGSYDAGAGNDASAGSDGGAAVDAGNDPDAAASPDGGSDAGSSTVSYRRAWQCTCGRCPSASEVCSALNTPGGLGGP